MSDFCSSTVIGKARKEHKCEICGSLIKEGESYVKTAGVWEGNFFHQKTCPQCNEIITWYCTEIENEYDPNDILGDTFRYPEVYKLLKQIKHPSDFVLGLIEDYEEEERERRE